MSGHTKGPWFIKPARGHSGQSVVHTGPWVSGCSEVTFDEQDANSRLIAAAPALLEALEDITFENDWTDNLELVDRVKAAIAAARSK